MLSHETDGYSCREMRNEALIHCDRNRIIPQHSTEILYLPQLTAGLSLRQTRGSYIDNRNTDATKRLCLNV